MAKQTSHTSTPSITPTQLKGIFTIWLACTVNPKIYAAIKANHNGEQAQIVSKTGLLDTEVDSLISKASSAGANDSLFNSVGALFEPFTAPAYPGGHTCDTLAEILGALYQ